MLLGLLLSVLIGYVDPFYARMAEEDCLYDPYGEGFDGTNDRAVNATARYETFVHMHDGVEIPKLGPGERIVVVDVEVWGAPDGLCRQHCTSWHCVYSVEVLCWGWFSGHYSQDENGNWYEIPPGCSYQHLLHEGEDRTRCIGGEQLL